MLLFAYTKGHEESPAQGAGVGPVRANSFRWLGFAVGALALVMVDVGRGIILQSLDLSRPLEIAGWLVVASIALLAFVPVLVLSFTYER